MTNRYRPLDARERSMLSQAQGNLAQVESVAREIEVTGTCRRDDGALPLWPDIPPRFLQRRVPSARSGRQGNAEPGDPGCGACHDKYANLDNQILGEKHGQLPSPPQQDAIQLSMFNLSGTRHIHQTGYEILL
jgi:hypothetical protein